MIKCVFFITGDNLIWQTEFSIYELTNILSKSKYVAVHENVQICGLCIFSTSSVMTSQIWGRGVVQIQWLIAG